ncbi:hypothetical protein [Eubacterium pyruvativorans]|uniref:hypothetical protein n=1 Tax=Eubacterium pyruvativorans TaxID=155865 RepID=UPI0015673993|nr:hypothetical protein [Eubacterium pyruvativorans]
MKQIKNKKDYLIATILITVVVACMTGSAEGLVEREIIFPEIAALATGMILTPHKPWKVNGPRIIFFITLCAVCGMIIVQYVHLPLLLQILLAYAVGQFILGISGTSLGPMISAIVLPVLLQSAQIVYPVSAFLLCLMIVLLRKVMEAAGFREPDLYEPLPPGGRQVWIKLGKRLLLVLLFGLICIPAGWRFCIAPPLLVAFQEFTDPACPARRKPVRAVLLLGLMAMIGSYSRILLCRELGLPVTAAAVVTMLFLSAAYAVTGMFLPPAGAMGILPMLVPEKILFLFPLQVLTGSAVLMAMALLFFRAGKTEKRS